MTQSKVTFSKQLQRAWAGWRKDGASGALLISNKTFKIILVVAEASSRYCVFGAGLLGSLQEIFWLLSRVRATQKALTEHTLTLRDESKDAGWKGRNSDRHTREQRLGTGPAPRI